MLSAASGCDATGPTAAEPPVRKRTSGITTPPLKVGDLLPPLDAEGWVNGEPPRAGAPGARLVVVDAWAPWCPFCARSAPGLVRLFKKYSPQGAAFVSIASVDRDEVMNFVRSHSVPWPNGYGAPVEVIAALGLSSGMPGPSEYEVAPTLYLVGTDGRVRWTDARGRMQHKEPVEWERTVDAAIADALAAPAKP